MTMQEVDTERRSSIENIFVLIVNLDSRNFVMARELLRYFKLTRDEIVTVAFRTMEYNAQSYKEYYKLRKVLKTQSIETEDWTEYDNHLESKPLFGSISRVISYLTWDKAIAPYEQHIYDDTFDEASLFINTFERSMLWIDHFKAKEYKIINHFLEFYVTTTRQCLNIVRRIPSQLICRPPFPLIRLPLEYVEQFPAITKLSTTYHDTGKILFKKERIPSTKYSDYYLIFTRRIELRLKYYKRANDNKDKSIHKSVRPKREIPDKKIYSRKINPNDYLEQSDE